MGEVSTYTDRCLTCDGRGYDGQPIEHAATCDGMIPGHEVRKLRMQLAIAVGALEAIATPGPGRRVQHAIDTLAALAKIRGAQ